jgi:hypothetical protein
MPAAEVIASYHDLWQVEQSFRMSKTDLRARPMFARTRDAIEAHLTIVFTALALSREVQRRTGLTIRNVVRQLRPTALSDHRDQRRRRRPSHPRSPTAQQALLDAITSKQLYLPDTAVLVTRFMTEAGVGEVVDFMPGHRHDGHRPAPRGPHGPVRARPDDLRDRHRTAVRLRARVRTRRT